MLWKCKYSTCRWKCNPIRDIEIINLELAISDLEIINNRLDKIVKKAETNKDKELLKEIEILNKCKESLEKGIPLRKIDLSLEEVEILKVFNFITLKPMIYLANINDEDLVNLDNPYINKIKEYTNQNNDALVLMSAKIESELVELEESEKEEFLKELGINMSGLDNLINITYKLLGLKTFFTVGKDEVRAWTFKDGMKAPDCAGLIHTDFKRGFIKAEIMSYEDLVK